MPQKPRCIGILTSGGDCPGLNAAIRGVARAALHHKIKVVGILDGFRGLAENRSIPLDNRAVSSILTLGGTILGTSRDKPKKMRMGERIMDMTDVLVANARRQQIDTLVCLGGNGTQKNAFMLQQAGLNVVTLPKTIDNDVAETDITFGFDTALHIATEAIDRLHTTATSHHRIIVCEIMGHRAGWLTLGAGIAGGADVILIPEIPYDLNVVANHLIERRQQGKRFSIIAVAEGAISTDEDKAQKDAAKEGKKKKKNNGPVTHHDGTTLVQESMAERIARKLQAITGIDTRTTTLGHVQRGGPPSATDRLLCTRLGVTAGDLIAQGQSNLMVAVKGEECLPIPLDEVAGKLKLVPKNHPLLQTAALVETSLGSRDYKF